MPEIPSEVTTGLGMMYLNEITTITNGPIYKIDREAN